MSHGKWGQENRTWGNMGALIMGHGKIWGPQKEDMEKICPWPGPGPGPGQGPSPRPGPRPRTRHCF